MLYAIMCKKPFIYLYNEKEDILKSDFDFIVDNPDECDMPKDFVPEEYVALTPSGFSKVLDATVKDGDVYTFMDGVLVRRRYKSAPHFYVEPYYGIEYPTYCPDANTIKAALMTNEELTPVIASLMEDYFQDGTPEVSLETPLTLDTEYSDYNVLAYVCMPVLMKKIPIGVETEEEKQELEADIEDTEV